MTPKIISFAINAHQSVNHLYDEHSYAVHLAMTAQYGVKYIDSVPEDYHDAVLSACWLHDVIEDCRLTYNDVKEVAGMRVAEIVFALTNEKGKTRKERANDAYYQGIISVPFAKYVKLCDRLANVAYSHFSKSRMLETYAKENESFLNALFGRGDAHYYKDAIEELKRLLCTPPVFAHGGL